MWNRNKNTSIYANTSSASDGGGTVGGTSSPGGSFGKPVNYVNDSPFSNTNNEFSNHPFHPRRLYGRRGHAQGAQNMGGGFSRLFGGYRGGGSGSNIGMIVTGGVS